MTWIRSVQTQCLCVAALLCLTVPSAVIASNPCDETQAATCHALAYCDDVNGCHCGEGIVGNGVGATGCNRESWTVRFTLLMPVGTLSTNKKLDAWAAGVDGYTALLTASPPAGFSMSMEHSVHETADGIYMTINALFAERSAADAARVQLASNLDQTPVKTAFGVDLVTDNYTVEPRVYTWVAKTTSAEHRIMPTGLDVKDVYFKVDCLDAGCWVVSFVYTVGEENFNVLYLPEAVGNDDLSYDFDYSTPDAVWGKSPVDTYLPMNFPCGSDTYDYQSLANGNPPHQITSCCIPEFIDMYRPVTSFKTEIDGLPITKATCDSADPDALVIFERPNYDSGDGFTYTPRPNDAIIGNFKGMAQSNVAFTSVLDASIGQYQGTLYLDEVELRQLAGLLTGTVGVEYAVDTFLGIANFKPTGLKALDPFAMQVNIRLEKTSFFTVAMHGTAAQTFIEYVNVRLVSIFDEDEDLTEDSAISQKAKSDLNNNDANDDGVLDETEFNDGGLDTDPSYPPFETIDINDDGVLSEIELAVGIVIENSADKIIDSADSNSDGVLDETEWTDGNLDDSPLYPSFEETDLNGDGVVTEDELTEVDTKERGEELARTDRTGAANYVQVTFTLGPDYVPDENGIVPLDSVLLGIGNGTDTDAIDVQVYESCTDYVDEVGSFDTSRGIFDSRFPQDDGSQDCAPQAKMCENQDSAPHQFVVFNIPLGIDKFPEPSNQGDSFVSVEMAIAVKDTSVDPAEVGSTAAGQMKTTIKASVPVVEGGIFLFCDQVVAKTDLKDVANVDLIIGTAGFAQPEMPRLTIHQDIANSAMDQVKTTEINTDSIEAGFMTLVVKGNSSYFTRSASSLYGVQVEDLITIHIMEEGYDMMDKVLSLVQAPGDDNNNANGLDTDGYALNGAFRFHVDRVNSRASLLPTDALYELCPAIARRPNPEDAFPTTCVMRRDIQARSYPALSGQPATAMEVPGIQHGRTAAARDEAALFMQTVLGPSDYAYELGQNYSYIIADRYKVNERYIRAFWINPGYEWTPTQTGGQDLFTISQKLILFAMINMDEGFGSGTRRRMLLQTTSGGSTEGTGSGMGAAQLLAPVTPSSMMAGAYKVPQELVATFNLWMQLTEAEACMSPADLKPKLRETLDYQLGGAASAYLTAQVVSFEVTAGTVQCGNRRALPRRLMAFSDSSVYMEAMVVFAAGDSACVNLERLKQQPGIVDVQPREVSDLIKTCNAYNQPTDQPLTARPAGSSIDPFAPTGSSPPVGGWSQPNQEQQYHGPASPNNAPAPHAPQPEHPEAEAGLPLMPIAAGVCACLILAAGGYMVLAKRRRATTHEASVIHSINVGDLKNEQAPEKALTTV